jgi:hypothetical protein
MRADLVVGHRGLTLTTLAEMWRFAECVIQSGMFPQFKTTQQALVAMEMGAELGVPYLQSLQNITVINGRAAVWGDMMLALVYDSQLLQFFEEKLEGEDDRAIAYCTVKRRGFDGVTTRTFSMADAKRAGLTTKDNWRTYPKRMLQMRARGFALRDVFPDVLKGLITREEAEDMFMDSTARETPAALPATAGRTSWAQAQKQPSQSAPPEQVEDPQPESTPLPVSSPVQAAEGESMPW